MKKLIALLLLSAFLFFGISYGQADVWYLGRNNNGAMTNAEITALALLTQTEIEILDDLTATTAELNIMSGVTATAAEINILDGATATYNEINALDASLYWTYTEEFIGVKYDTTNARIDSSGAITVSGVNAQLEGWNIFGSAGWAFTQAAGTLGGILTVTCLTGSDNEFSMQLGELGTETFVEFTESSGKSMWIDFRVQDTDTSASAANFFIGLAEEGATVTDFIADAGTDIANLDVVGFVQWEAADDTVQVLYQTSGGAFVDTFKTQIGQTQTLYSIVFDGDSTITFLINGTSIGTVEQDTKLFPDTEELSPIIAVKQGAQDRVLALDLIRIICER